MRSRDSGDRAERRDPRGRSQGIRCGQQAREASDTLLLWFGRSSRDIHDSRSWKARLMVRFAPRDACAGRSDARGTEAATRFLELRWMGGESRIGLSFLGRPFLRNKWLELI